MNPGEVWWEPLGATARGSAHVRAGTPNQDSWAASAPGPCAVVAVADGHGSQRCPRSATGARLAASIAVEAVASTLEGPAHEATERLMAAAAPVILESWRQAVRADLESAPFTAAEAAVVAAGATDLAYGTTLVVVAADPSGVSVLGIGDGHVVVLRPDGEVTLVMGGEMIGTETASLAHPDALAQVEFAHVVGPVSALWASTDGFGTAFESRQWWRDVARDLGDRIGTLASEELAARMPGWVEAPAAIGGDDATMAVLVRRIA